MTRVSTSRLAGSIAAACTGALLVSSASAGTFAGMNSEPLAAGASTVQSCDADGFTVADISAGPMTIDLTVAGIDAACSGGLLTVNLANGAGAAVASVGPVTVPPGGGSIALTALSHGGDLGVLDFDEVHVRISGP